MAKWYDPNSLILECRPGDTGVIRNRFGQTSRGRATICNARRDPDNLDPDNLTVVLNMGGRYGTPDIATPENVVSVAGKKSVTEGYSLDPEKALKQRQG
jgi:hypothetical protein